WLYNWAPPATAITTGLSDNGVMNCLVVATPSVCRLHLQVSDCTLRTVKVRLPLRGAAGPPRFPITVNSCRNLAVIACLFLRARAGAFHCDGRRRSSPY